MIQIKYEPKELKIFVIDLYKYAFICILYINDRLAKNQDYKSRYVTPMAIYCSVQLYYL